MTQSTDSLDLDSLLASARFAAHRAGSYLVGARETTVESVLKADASPVSEADLIADSLIRELLDETRLDVISEESGNEQDPTGPYWLVDPLDGTKEFLKGDPHFTVNIALMVESQPIIGVVVAPALNEEHFALNIRKQINEPALEVCHSVEEVRIVCSQSHPEGEVALFRGAAVPLKVHLMGSAIKFARISAGIASVYPRLAGSSEWDTAAGHALVEAAGGGVVEWPTLRPLSYGKPHRRNPGFIAYGAGCDVRRLLSSEALKQVKQ